MISVVGGVGGRGPAHCGVNLRSRIMSQEVKLIFRTMMAAEFSVGLVSPDMFLRYFPVQIISVFGSEDGLYNEFAVLAFPRFPGGVVLCCIQKSCSIFLSPWESPPSPCCWSLLRDFVLRVPLTLVLPRFFGVTGALYPARRRM